MSESLREYACVGGEGLRVDRAAGVIRNVKILGLRSRNGRVYAPEALSAAIGLYEEAKVNVNHPAGAATATRDYRDRIGTLRRVRHRPGEGLFGDLHFNPKHALAEQLMWDAEHAPENVGLSHNVVARTSRRGAETVVEAIVRVQSVDLVADPATTQGLYESSAAATAVVDPGTSAAAAIAARASSAQELPAQVLAGRSARAMANSSVTEDTDRVSNTRFELGPVDDRSVTAVAAAAPSAADASILLAEATLDQVRALRPELVASIEHAAAAELQRLREEAIALQREAETCRQECAIDALLHEYGLARQGAQPGVSAPSADAASATAFVEASHAGAFVTPAFIESLRAALDPAAMRALIEDRLQLVRTLESAGPRSPIGRNPPSGRAACGPRSRAPREHLPAALDTRAFVAAITE